MWDGLGFIDGTAIIILIVFYYIIKHAVKNGINASILGESSLKNKIDKDKVQ